MAGAGGPAKARQMGFEHIPAHFPGQPRRLQERVHRQPVQGGQKALRLGDQLFPAAFRRPGVPCRIVPRRIAFCQPVCCQKTGDQLPDDGGHRPVAPVRLGSKKGPDPCGIFEGKPRTGVQGTLFVQGKELAQQG